MPKKIRFTFEVRSPRGHYTQTLESEIPGIFKLGSLPSAHLKINDEDVSRIHAVIEVVKEKKIRIIDMGSEKGTKVNGKRKNKKWIEDGDTITLASTDIRVGIEIVDG